MTDVVAATALAPTRTVLICDPHATTWRALSEQLAARGSHLRVVSAVPDAAAVIGAFGAHPTDVVLIGIRAGTPNCLRAVDSLLSEHPSAPVITFGTAADSPLLTESILRGAQGFMLWDITRSAGPPAVVTQAARITLCHPTRLPRVLTEVQQRVLRGMSLGRSNREISSNLSLSEEVVNTSSRAIFRKLGAQDRAHAVALGFRGGMLT